MPRVTQKSVARYGTPIRTSVMPEVAAALLSEAKRCQRSVWHIAGEVLRYWYEDTYLPAQTKKNRPKAV